MSEPGISISHCAGANHGSNGTVNLVIIHDEEYPLSDTSDLAIAKLFSGACPPRNYGCAHYIESATAEQHVVPDSQIAYNAPPNGGTIGIERDGYASWSADLWNQPAAQHTTCRVAARAAELLVRHQLPLQWVSVAGQKAGQRGISDHASRSLAFGQSTHSDPGPAFPRAAFMALVLRAAAWVQDARSFQAAHGLTVDGDVGPATLEAMTAALFTGAPGGVPAPAPVLSPTAPSSYHDESPTGNLSEWDHGPRVAALQTALGVNPADGYFGTNTDAAVRAFQAAHHLAVDGVVGMQTQAALAPAPVTPPPAVPAHAMLAVDGDLGTATVGRLQQFLGVVQDGQLGPVTKRALQTWLHVAADGVVGPMTIRALQHAVGAGADGVWGSDTTKHLQSFLNGSAT